MRLTLRTLLAYLDDILEPTEAKEIGTKIQESNVATSLINRIRDVMRRRLTAPPLKGSAADVDLNTVSEYLDNTLPPEGVAEIEKTCLESDIHLAEVAACHQILTLVLGEPIEISAEGRERMYALGPIRAKLPEGFVGASGKQLAGSGIKPPSNPALKLSLSDSGVMQPPQEPRTEKANARPFAHSAARSPDDSIPEYLRPSPVRRRAIPYAVVAMLLAIVGMTVVIDPAFQFQGLDSWRGGEARNPTVASANTKVKADAAKGGGTESVEARESTPLTASIPQTPEGAAADGSTAEVASLAELTKPSNPDAEPLEVATVEPRGDKPTDPDAIPDIGLEEPPAQSVAKVDNRNPQLTAEGEPIPEGIPAAPVKVAPMQFASPADVVLLRYDTKDNAWFKTAPRTLVYPGETVAAPEPFEAMLTFGEQRNVLTLLGGTVITLLPPTAAAPTGIELQRGRIVLKRGGAPEAQNQADAQMTFALSVRGELWRVELLEPNTVCGVEVVLREPMRFEEDFGRDSYTGTLYVSTGSVRIAVASNSVEVIEGPGRFPLLAENRAVPSEKAEAIAIPAWLGDKKTSGPSYAKLFEKQFDFDEPAAVSMATASKDKNANVSRLAVTCLGLIGADEALIQALSLREHEESRTIAITGLRNWINLDPQNREKLKEDLANHFHKPESDLVYRLIWGLSVHDLRDRKASEQLVGWLEHDNLAIRELAYYYVVKLIGKPTNGYRPTADNLRRKSAISLWRKQIEKTGALIAPVRESRAPGIGELFFPRRL